MKVGTPSNEELEEVAVEIGGSWQSLGRRLKFSDAQITAFHEENENPREKRYKMLLRWKQGNGVHASYQVLHQALCHHLVGRRDLATKFCCDKGLQSGEHVSSPSETASQPQYAGLQSGEHVSSPSETASQPQYAGRSIVRPGASFDRTRSQSGWTKIQNRLQSGEHVSSPSETASQPQYADVYEKEQLTGTEKAILDFRYLQKPRVDANQTSKEDDLLNDLRQNARSDGFIISDNPGGGNCMFYALAEQLGVVKGISISYDELRRRLLAHLQSNPKLANGTDLYSFVVGHSSWNDYLKYMGKDGTWGNHVVLVAAANCFQVPVHVISSLPNHRNITIDPESPVDNTNPLVIGHVHELHYVSLLPELGPRIEIMKIPAFAQPDLYLGRAFNAISSSATVDAFDHNAPKKTEYVNSFSFQYTSLENTRDVGGFLDVSDDILLRLMAGMLKVEGRVKYLTDNTRKEGTTEIVAVMKCLTLREILDKSAEPLVKARAARKEDLGTHYVKSVVYGADVLASIKFKKLEDTKRRVIKGSVTGELPAIAKDPSLDSQLDKFFSECDVAAELEVKVYATGLKPRIATDLKSFRQLLEELPSLIMDNGRGVAMEYEIQPLGSIGLEYLPCVENNAVIVRLGDVREKFDDLLSTQKEVSKYEEENGNELSVELADLAGQVDNILLLFRLTIAELSVYGATDQFKECTRAYKEGLLQSGGTRKYLAYWRKLTKPSKEPGESYKLREGEPVTVLLLGKTGTGKSATGNQIVGHDKAFKVSHSPVSTKMVQGKGQFGVRRGERVIEVIDTLGVLDTKIPSELKTFEELENITLKELKKEKRELSRIFSMTPDGIHAILLFIRYDTRWTSEDAAAMLCLLDLIGKDALGYVIFAVTHGDEARKHAKELNMPLEDHLIKTWRQRLPPWMETVIQQAGNRLVLFDSGFNPQDDLQANVRQVNALLQVIDTMIIERQPFTNKITENARSYLDKELKSAMDAYTKERDDIQKRLAKESRLPEGEKSSLKKRLVELGKLIEDEKGLRTQLRQRQSEDVENERGSWKWRVKDALTALQMAATATVEVVAFASVLTVVAVVDAVIPFWK